LPCLRPNRRFLNDCHENVKLDLSEWPRCIDANHDERNGIETPCHS
jgi:hypothetical protein